MDPAETHDIFVSYAHADNGVALGASSPVGWVSALAANLNEGPGVLRKRIFIDHQLKPGDEFSGELLTRVERSRLLVLLLSQNYLDSKWCGDELQHFVHTHGGDPEKPADVFVVEIFPFDAFTAVPPIIGALRKRLIHAKFWYQPVNSASPVLAGYPSPKDSGHKVAAHYWSVLNELRVAIDSRLRSLRAAAPVDAAAAKAGLPTSEPEAAVADARRQDASAALGTVLLADTTEDLELQRNAVKLALEPEGIVVLPEGDYVGLSCEEFGAAFAADLARSDLFVQLLSPTAGRKARGFPAPLPQLQFERARQAGRPIMQWCEQLPVDGQIVDPAHAALFATESLRVTHLAGFRSEVLERIERLHTEKIRRERAAAAAQTGPAAARTQRKLVFVDDLASVPALTGRLSSIIREQSFELRGLPPNTPLGNNGIDVRELLRPCRAGITIYADRSKYLAVYNRLLYFLNQLAENGLAIERWGVYLEHGTVASEFRIESDDVVAVNEQCLGDFLRGL